MKVHTVAVYDVTIDRRTAQHLLGLMQTVMNILVTQWLVFVIAVASDASGESRAAQVELLKLMPYLVVPDCFGHQVFSLIVF